MATVTPGKASPFDLSYTKPLIVPTCAKENIDKRTKNEAQTIFFIQKIISGKYTYYYVNII
jgi:hypothetical protein